MSEVKVNKISPRTACGTTTLGDSGDTFTIPAGVTITNNGTQTGFGRTGTVNWDTTAKTGDFTAVSGNGYFVNTTSGTITVTLPASPSGGDIVYVKDYTGTFADNACTVARNSSNIRGATNNFTLEKANSGAVFIYVDGTEGWQVFVDGSDADAAIQYISATGGTITTSGNCKIHTFTGPGTFTVNSVSCSAANNAVAYMVVAGGGGSGRSYGGGAGAGGFREGRTNPITPYTASPLVTTGLTVTATDFPITVGGGGAKATPSVPANPATDGSNSIFSTITSTGGGGAGHYSNTADPSNSQREGRPGGSGGGGADGPTTGGNGNSPPVSPSQGNNGGTGFAPSRAAGGGGATAVGANGSGSGAGAGGAGATTSITGSPTAYAGGGGGFGNEGGAAAGTGGGGAGGNPGVAGTVNTGGGAGGTGSTPNCDMTNLGGSGIVVIRYKFQ